MRFYPRSFSMLLFVGFALIALPLMIALINNAISIDRLGNQSRNAVYQAVQATQSSRRLAELIPQMERAAHQMIILGERSLLDTYAVHRKQLLATATEFSRLPFDTEQRTALREIVQGEEAIYKLLSDPSARAEDVQKAVQAFVGLAERAQAINQRSNELIDREVENMSATAWQAQQITLWQLLALFPVVIFLVVGFTILIARPIRQIDGSIRRLGQADFSQPVQVGGPEDLQQLGERLDWMRTRLADLEQQKNRFLRHMSHELKTPLTALREGAELLSEEVVGKLAPEQREIAEILRHNSIELQKLIEDLLSYGASQGHKPEVDAARVELRRVASRVIDDQKLALRAKQLRLDLKMEDIALSADPEKLRVMLDNLVSNAIKFSPPGGTITVQAQRRGDEIELEVLDQGPGIAPEERDLVFQPFYRGRHAADALVKGTGIGLSVVREYAHMHGGSAEVVDGAAGAHIRIRVPMDVARSDCAAGTGRCTGDRTMITRLTLVAALLSLTACATMVAEEDVPEPEAETGTAPAVAPRAAPPAKIAIAPPITPPPPPVVVTPPAPQLARSIEVDSLLTEFGRLRRLPAAEVAREQEAARQVFNQTRSDPARMRLAMTMTVPGSAGNDETRALDLLDPLVKNPTAPLHGLAFLMAAYIQEQRRLAAQVQGLQQNAQGLQQNVHALEKKLDALRTLERSLSEREAGGRRR